ncbi:hypothetical protein [Allosalinactinospora lopnorensis]|uniref:hypothetical protein n=1 Tax=Allosalinactinospora lopnorensis TaxID=1352348 RepID=UPI00308433C2
MVYRSALGGAVPEEVPEQAAEAARESIGGAAAVAEGLSGAEGRALLEAAQSAFGLGLQSAYGFGAVLLTLVAVLVAWWLRHAGIATAETEDGPGDPAAQAAERPVPERSEAPAGEPTAQSPEEELVEAGC